MLASDADVDRALTHDRTHAVTWLNRGTLHLVHRDVGVVADATLGRPARDVVRDAVPRDGFVRRQRAEQVVGVCAGDGGGGQAQPQMQQSDIGGMGDILGQLMGAVQQGSQMTNANGQRDAGAVSAITRAPPAYALVAPSSV